MGVTIKQIAEMAGVHRSTVDKVLHNRPGVSDPVRKRVQQLIEQCDYHANPIGKALKMQDKTIHIAVILLNIDAKKYLKEGIEHSLKKYNSFKVETEYIVLEDESVERQAETLKSCREAQPDAIILTPMNDSVIVQEINKCKASGIPVITMNTDVKGSKRLCFIGQDGYKGGQIAGRLMGEFLQGTGNVVIVTSDNDNSQTFPFGTREGGFRDVLHEFYPDVQIVDTIQSGETLSALRSKIRLLCENHPDTDGLFITCGGVKAVGDVLEELHKTDLKFICYENYPEIKELLEKGIVTATLDSNILEQGEQAVDVMMNYLVYNRKPKHKHLYTETNILLKESI